MNRREFLFSVLGAGIRRGALTCLCATCSRRLLLSAIGGLGATALPGCAGSEAGSSQSSASPSPNPSPSPSPSPSPNPSPTPAPAPGSEVTSPYKASFVETEIKNPSLYGMGAGPNFWNGCKHIRIVECNGYLYQHSGDYAGYPYQQRSDYPPSGYWGDSQRQDMWRASMTPNSAGRIEWELSQNFYHNYPWNGSSGRLSPEPQRGPFMPDAFGWVVDKRGDFWSGPWGSGYSGVTGDAAGLIPGYEAMFKWKMPGLHSNGIRLGDGWALPSQDRLGVDVPSAPRATGRTAESAYDPVTDAIYVVGHDYVDYAKQVVIQIRKFSCVPTNGKHRWEAINLPTPISALGAPSSFSSANVTWEHANCAIAGRYLYYPFLCEYGVPAGQGNSGSDLSSLRVARLVSINLDTLSVSYVALPAAMPWWTRTWDGPEKGLGFDPGVTGEKRAMEGVGDKLVLGPDHWHKIGVDPWICIYDQASNSWTLYDPPTDHDWPNTLGSLSGVPSRNEVWLIGNGAIGGGGQSEVDFRNAKGLHNPPANAGRRIVKFRLA